MTKNERKLSKVQINSIVVGQKRVKMGVGQSDIMANNTLCRHYNQVHPVLPITLFLYLLDFFLRLKIVTVLSVLLNSSDESLTPALIPRIYQDTPPRKSGGIP